MENGIRLIDQDVIPCGILRLNSGQAIIGITVPMITIKEYAMEKGKPYHIFIRRFNDQTPFIYLGLLRLSLIPLNNEKNCVYKFFLKKRYLEIFRLNLGDYIEVMVK